MNLAPEEKEFGMESSVQDEVHFYEEKKQVCLWMFRQGLGYKRISLLLGLSLYTVRDYGRRFRKGDPSFALNIEKIPDNEDLVRFVRIASTKEVFGWGIEKICSFHNIPLQHVLEYADHGKKRSTKTTEIYRCNIGVLNPEGYEGKQERGIEERTGLLLPGSDGELYNAGSGDECKGSGIFKKKGIRKVDELVAQGYSIKDACKAAGIPRSTYYRKRNGTSKEKSDLALGCIMLNIQSDSFIKFSYGIERLTAAVNNYIETRCTDDDKMALGCRNGRVNHKRIQRLMKEFGLNSFIKRAERPKGYYLQKRAEKEAGKAPNILNREFFEENRPYSRLATDVTYIPTLNGKFLYFSPLMDLSNQEILAYSISATNNSDLVESMLRKVPADRLDGALLHTDQGVLYTSNSWVTLCKELGITRSMSRRGNCWDNSIVEGFFSRMKSELNLTKSRYRNIYDDKMIVAMVEGYVAWYNNSRIQKRLKYMSPVQYRVEQDKMRKESILQESPSVSVSG